MEIAWSLFEDLSHFIKFFKKNVNITPNVFRKNFDSTTNSLIDSID
ncbi:hypothetical protein CJ739_3098 [Mariniflexile rhizosphaerae]|nr:hypothetical protein CJ739_3098 [Mariniflexile sp. TRM1-10]PLB20193.1 MAG: hypothetical protein TRG1_842 [Flavobacteriaceae bacterium FS1-H7996/R]